VTARRDNSQTHGNVLLRAVLSKKQYRVLHAWLVAQRILTEGEVSTTLARVLDQIASPPAAPGHAAKE